MSDRRRVVTALGLLLLVEREVSARKGNGVEQKVERVRIPSLQPAISP